MLFTLLQERLIALLRNRVRAGELTERGLARLTGLSQPHMHNVLKGIRSLSQQYADRILEQLDLSVSDLLTPAELRARSEPDQPEILLVPWLIGLAGPSFVLSDDLDEKTFTSMPVGLIKPLTRPVMVKLAHDDRVYPFFQAGDLALVDRAHLTREELQRSGVYLVRIEETTLVRSLRVGGSRLYLLTPDCLDEPRRWESVPLSGRDFAKIVKGRIVWIGREITA